MVLLVNGLSAQQIQVIVDLGSRVDTTQSQKEEAVHVLKLTILETMTHVKLNAQKNLKSLSSNVEVHGQFGVCVQLLVVTYVGMEHNQETSSTMVQMMMICAASQTVLNNHMNAM